MKEFNISIYAADKIFFFGKCQSLVIPTSDGLYGVLAGHRNTITAIAPGKIKYTVKGKDYYAVVSKGLAKIENGMVLILVDTCEKPEEIDRVRAKKAREEAKRALTQKTSQQEFLRTQANLARAINRLKNSRKRDRQI